VRIAELPQLAADPLLAEYLASSGLGFYRKTDATPPELAARALRGTLACAELDPRQIDVVVWGSTSFQDRGWYTEDVSAVLEELGLGTATAIGVTLSECGNLAAVLRVAAALVGAGHRHVLAVVTDRCASAELRLVAPSVAVLSDGAAACVVSADPRGYELVAIHQVTNHRARPRPDDQAIRVLRHNAEGMRRAAYGALQAARVAASDVAHLITSNLARSIVELFAAQCGVGLERVFSQHVASHGHVFAADGLINLAALPAEPAQHILLATNGTCNWGAAVLRRCGGRS
jgi:3-oxoacyl-[acyl-carrier-protein] synthase-3